MASVKKPTLRELAVAQGLAKPNDLKLFQMDIDVLIDLLKPEFPGIEELDEDGVLDLTAKIKKGGGKGGSKEDDEPRGRGRGKEEEKEEPRGRGRAKEEEKEEPRGRGRGKADEKEEEAPRGRGRGKAEEKEEEAPRGRGRSSEKEEEAPRGRGRSSEKEEEAPRGRGRGEEKEDPKDEPRGRGRGRGAEKEEEAPKDEPRGRGRGKADEKEEAANKGSKSDDGGLTKLLEAVLDGQSEIGKRLGALEKSVGEIDAKVDAADTNTTKALKVMKTQLAEVHVGVESIYLNDINTKDKDLAAVLKRVSD